MEIRAPSTLLFTRQTPIVTNPKKTSFFNVIKNLGKSTGQVPSPRIDSAGGQQKTLRSIFNGKAHLTFLNRPRELSTPQRISQHDSGGNEANKPSRHVRFNGETQQAKVLNPLGERELASGASNKKHSGLLRKEEASGKTNSGQRSNILKNMAATSKKSVDARVTAQHESIVMLRNSALIYDCKVAIKNNMSDLNELAGDLEFLKDQLLGLQSTSAESTSNSLNFESQRTIDDLVDQINVSVSDADSTIENKSTLKFARGLEEHQSFLQTCEETYDNGKQLVSKAANFLESNGINVELNCTTWVD